MKYNLKAFNNAVKYYQNSLKKYKNSSILIISDLKNTDAYYSIAPLSKAIHNLNSDLNVVFKNKHSKAHEAFLDVWQTHKDLKKGVKNKKTAALSDFIKIVDKKAKGKFKKIFKEPDLIFKAGKCFNHKELCLAFKPKWFKPYKTAQLKKTAKTIWSQVINLKEKETVALAFELIPKNLFLPLEDYLDSYPIARAMSTSIKNKKVGMAASTSRESMLASPTRISDLKATLLGCELEKNINDPVFKKYKKLSTALKLNRLRPSDASFFIHGKGYSGQHLFGQVIGYPTKNKKSRWTSPAEIVYKFSWYPQAKYESRPPRSRVCFTETLPIDIFIKTNNINWFDMQKRNKTIAKIVNSADKILVRSKTSNFDVYLKGPKGRRLAKTSGTETRSKINQEYYKKTKIKTGNMANLPGGEAFLTPEYIKGIFYGDVVISIDQSYPLSKKQPLVVKANEKGYKIIKGPEKIIAKIKQKKKESWKNLLTKEKHKSLPKKIIALKKKNFNKIGEFAINTNPKAELCRYLIVNEKIANMIHIALGAGFEPDRSTEYHYDIVINAKQQKLDIYGKKGKKEYWILKNGAFVI